MISTTQDFEMIKQLIGDWKAEATVTKPDGTSVEGTGTWTVREISLGKGVHTVMKINVEGQAIEENDLLGYDAGGQKVHMLSITSDGSVHDHVGNMRADDVLFLRWDGIVDGKPSHEEIEIDRLSPDEIRALSIEYLDGKEMSRFTCTMKRE